MRAIASECIPSVDVAQSITCSIGIIDAQVADYLVAAGLTRRTLCVLAGFQNASTARVLSVHACGEHNIDARSALVNQQIFEVAHNVTYPGERTAVERIMIGLQRYLGGFHQMCVDCVVVRSKADQNDHMLRQASQAYLDASAVPHNRGVWRRWAATAFHSRGGRPVCLRSPCSMGGRLRPSSGRRGWLADAPGSLSSINYQHLQGAYSDSASFLGGSTDYTSARTMLRCQRR